MPYKQGISNVRQVYGDAAGGAPLRKLKTGGTLTDLRQDYTLFTFAPLFMYGGLDFNPINEWVNVYDNSPEVTVFQLETPILTMHGVNQWDNTLWAVPNQLWPSLSLHIGALALIDRLKQTLTRT